jgi:hypothetical protein
MTEVRTATFVVESVEDGEALMVPIGEGSERYAPFVMVLGDADREQAFVVGAEFQAEFPIRSDLN